VHYELRAHDDRPLPTPMLGDLRPDVGDERRQDENETTALMVLDLTAFRLTPELGPPNRRGWTALLQIKSIP
jgi:hypothetical protein